MPAVNIRCQVAAVGALPGTLELTPGTSILGLANPPTRPLLGTGQFGWHWQPRPGDIVVALGEIRDGWCTTSVAADLPGNIRSMNPGELGAWHPDGRVLANALNSGLTTILNDPGHHANLSYTGSTTTWSMSTQNALGGGGGPARCTLTMDQNGSTNGFFDLQANQGTLTLRATGALGGSTITVAQTQITLAAGQLGTLLTGHPVAITDAPATATATALLEVGPGPFDGSSTGFFTGNSQGTLIAANAASGYAGDLLMLQTAGVPEFSVSAAGAVAGVSAAFSGAVSVGGTLGVTGLATLTGGAALGADLTMQTHNIKNVGFISDGATAGAGNWSIDSAGNGVLSGTLGVTGLATLTGGAALGADCNMQTHNIKNVGFISDGASVGTGNWSVSSGGNALLAGTLGVTGLATLTGGAAAGATLNMNSNNITNVALIGNATTAGGGLWSIDSAGNGLLSGTLGVTGLATLTGGAVFGNVVNGNAQLFKNIGSLSNGAAVGSGNFSIDPNGNTLLNGTLTVGSHVAVSGPTPASAVLGATSIVGTGGSLGIAHTGSDQAGVVTVVTGASGISAANAAIFTLNFGLAWAVSPRTVQVQAYGAGAIPPGTVYAINLGTGSFQVACTAQLNIGGSYAFSYIVIG